MDIGMLWLDDNKKRPFAKKVQRAAEYYREKYGEYPDTCLVNECLLDGEIGEINVSGITVSAARNILPHYYWIGVSDGNIERDLQIGRAHV